MTTHDDLDTIRSIIKSSTIATLTTVGATGELHSRPLAVLDHEFEGSLWFFTQNPSPKTDEVADDPQVNVAYSDGKGYLSIAGTAAVDLHQSRIDQLWTAGAEAWFPGGRDDPSVALLRVDASSAEYWSSDKPAIARAFEFAKSLVTHDQPDVGENRTVQL